MEYLQVFDRSGKSLDEKILRENVKQLDDGKYFMIILIIIENNGKLLMQITSEEKDHVCALTGGHVQFCDDGITTCIKEVKEELGLELVEDEIKYLGTHKAKKVLLNVYYTNKEVDINSLVLQESEVESVIWISMDEINKLKEKNELRQTNVVAFEIYDEFKRR